jgi:hypothetical protein
VIPLRIPLPVLLLACTGLLAACTTHVHQPYRASAGTLQAMPVAQRPAYYDYRAPRPEVETYALPFQQLDGYAVSGIRFPSSERNGQPGNLVDARYFRSETAGPKPLLIVLPIWATHTFPSTVISNGYALHSGGRANVLWMQGDGALFDWFAIADVASRPAFDDAIDAAAGRFRAAAMDVRRLIDWAETRPEIDSTRIGIIGFSMSALVGANVAGNDPRVHTAVYVLGGAHPWDMMAECNLVVEYMRKSVSETLGWDQERYRDYFRDKLRYGDPALWRGSYRSENTLIIESSRDDCIPAGSRASLFAATGEPERILYPYNHWQPFLSMTPVGRNVLTRDIFEFLDRNLLQGQPTPHRGSHQVTSTAEAR